MHYFATNYSSKEKTVYSISINVSKLGVPFYSGHSVHVAVSRSKPVHFLFRLTLFV
jgi:hypothetical protein